MSIFFIYKYDNLFFTPYGLVDNFFECQFYNSMYVGISELQSFCDENDFDIDDFEFYVKGSVY